MVAASIQALAFAPHGTPCPADRIAASSQGVLMEAMDDIQGALGSEDRRSRVRSIGRASAVGVLVLSVLLFILFVAQIR